MFMLRFLCARTKLRPVRCFGLHLPWKKLTLKVDKYAFVNFLGGLKMY